MIFIPKPKDGESEKDYMSRCIPMVINDGTAKDEKQAAAICYSMWREHNKKQNNSFSSERVLLHLCASLNLTEFKNDKTNEYEIVDLERSTILVGDGVYNGVYFPKEELEKAFMSWNKQPININHSDLVEDVVGFIEQPLYERGRITVKPVLDKNTVKYNVAKGYVDSRLRARSIPEVSVGVWTDKTEIDEKYTGKYPSNAMFIAKNLQGDHLAFVTRGACSPKDGCGIGLSKDNTVTVPDEDYVNYQKKIESLKKEILKEKIKNLGGKIYG